jgi:hypothetical protein
VFARLPGKTRSFPRLVSPMGSQSACTPKGDLRVPRKEHIANVEPCSSETRVVSYSSRKLRVTAWRLRAYPAGCVSAQSRRSLVAIVVCVFSITISALTDYLANV